MIGPLLAAPAPIRIRRVPYLCFSALLVLAPASAAQLGASKAPAAALPTADHCEIGAWEPAFLHDLTGFQHMPPPDGVGLYNAVHMAVVPVGPHRGEVFTMDQGFVSEYPMQWQRMSLVDVSDPAAPAFENFELPMPVTTPEVGFELFCSGHVWLDDGRLFVAGGTLSTVQPSPDPSDDEVGLGVALAYTWDPTTGTDPATGIVGTWTRQPDMLQGRYYPSATLTGDGRVIVSGGTGGPSAHTLNSYEVWDVALGAWEPTGTSEPFPGPPVDLHGYPRMSLLTNGSLFLSGFQACSYLLDHAAAPGVWTPTDCSEGPDLHSYNSSLLMPGYEDVVLKIGGLVIDRDNDVLMNPTWIADVGAGATPGWDWQLLPAQPRLARSYANAVILPSGDVFLNGGYAGTGKVDDQGILIGADVLLPLQPEIYRRDTGTWTVGPNAVSPREYHSAAVLLPDGRVLTGGGEFRFSDYQVYRPWYLTCHLPRPVITVAPSAIDHQSASHQKYDLGHAPLPAGVTIARVVLIPPGTVTHHSDFQQRYVELEIMNQTSTKVRVLGPKTPNHAPSGWYMLFLVSSDGVPSEAAWVHVG